MNNLLNISTVCPAETSTTGSQQSSQQKFNTSPRPQRRRNRGTKRDLQRSVNPHVNPQVNPQVFRPIIPKLSPAQKRQCLVDYQHSSDSKIQVKPPLSRQNREQLVATGETVPVVIFTKPPPSSDSHPVQELTSATNSLTIESSSTGTMDDSNSTTQSSDPPLPPKLLQSLKTTSHCLNLLNFRTWLLSWKNSKLR